MKRKIIIADDHEIILDGLKSMLETETDIEILATANNGIDLISLIEEVEEIDLLVLDINMPGKDGIEVTKEIKMKYPEIKILILSMYKRSEFVQQLISMGADGYILKNAGKQMLLEAINTLVEGGSYFDEEVLKTIDKTSSQDRFTKDMEVVDLSQREKEVIQLIVSEKSTTEIADILCLSKHTIDSHRKSILNKLDVKNVAGIFRYALQSGLVKGFNL